MFALHPRLAADCVVLGDLPLCRLLLMNDRHYPWFILVPRREGIEGMHQLDEADQQQLTRESRALSLWLESAFAPERINVAALGNMVPQLHVHHVARLVDDAAWPAPIWGVVTPIPHDADAVEALRARVAAAALPDFIPSP